METILRKKVSYSLSYIIIISGLVILLWYSTDTLMILIGGIGVALWSFQLMVNLIKRVYIIYDGERVTIKHNFRKWIFNKSEIEYITINYTPFTSTYFKLKDGQKKHFNPWWLNKADRDKLLLICSKIKSK